MYDAHFNLLYLISAETLVEYILWSIALYNLLPFSESFTTNTRTNNNERNKNLVGTSEYHWTETFT